MKQIYLKITTTLALLACVLSANAYDFEVNGIYYNKLTDNTCEVTNIEGAWSSSYSGCYSGAITIPSTVKYDNAEFQVIQIGKSAFRNSKDLTSVMLSESVHAIGTYAFYNCSNLASVNIPKDVWTIEDYAFYGCSSLKTVSFPEKLDAIKNYAFANCTGLTSITIPNNVIYIGASAFQSCM